MIDRYWRNSNLGRAVKNNRLPVAQPGRRDPKCARSGPPVNFLRQAPLESGQITILIPIRPENFSSFAEAANIGYAQDNVTSGRWPAAEALSLAQAKCDQLLPKGPATPNHHIYEIQDESTDETVGFLWFAVVGAGDARSTYIYNVSLKQSFRRRGHAKAALMWLEQYANAHGLATCSPECLHP